MHSGEFRTGERLLAERGLMKMFGAGRNTICEAMQVLVSRGILNVRSGQEATVQEMNSEEVPNHVAFSALLADQCIDNLDDFRALVEVEASALAAERATPEQLLAIEQRSSEFDHASRERCTSVQADIAFHRAVVKACNNAIFSIVPDAVAELRPQFAGTVSTLIEQWRSRAASTMPSSMLFARNTKAARVAMADHIETASAAVREARPLQAKKDNRQP